MTRKEELEAQGYKTYENEDIQVFWKPRICQHAGECARGNYNVFNPQRRPWVDLSQAPATEIADTILFLSSEKAQMLTGQVIKVSGGHAL